MARPGGRVGAIPAKMVCHRGPGEAGTILAMRALREQAAVNSSRSLYIRRYRCSAGVRGPLGQTWAGRGAKSRWLVAAIKGGKKLDDFLIDKSAQKERRKRRSKR